ncbi:cytochrome P450 4c3 [Plutella xylostella]|uniref:cytochrome P450 4c3 n=1 Tax=Plutella xylostella TaxID=51655 RepID=UPI002032F7BC|nr:cytochrome P450 4c3 [Plutella xylostella]
MLSWSSAVLAAVTAGILGYWLHWRWSHRRMLQLAARLPGPRAWPVIGNALMFMRRPEDILGVISSLVREHGRYSRVWLGPELQVVVQDPADIRMLLQKVNKKGPSYEFLVPFIGEGILTGGPTWRLHRKLATPSYNKRSVQHFQAVFNEEAGHLARLLATKDPGKTFNVYEDVVDTTTQMVCRTLMGLSKKDAQSVHRLAEVVKETPNMYTLIFQKMTRWFYQIPMIYYLVGAKAKEQYYVKIVDDLSSDIVAKRRKALKEENVTSLEETDTAAIGIVDRYILSGELTEQEIKCETFSLFTTSQEAGAKIASGVLLVLAHLPNWQEKVYNEIVETLGPLDGEVSEEDVKRLQYLDMVYREVLRYLSIAALIQRTVEEEVTIDDGKLTLPVGTSLVIPIHQLHRDPAHWAYPDRVMPERFLPENCKGRDPNAFVPFSLGPMDCLGRVYATAMIKTLVVRLLRRLVFEASGSLESLELHVAISVRFAQGYRLRVRPRTVASGRVNA